ncbi:hypothetical protein CMV30_05100 [Nibricoccus aquaticus]|uniref:XRE family transcriptional regulator n=2 Tax=Nibricoccus aquaticus TaxID=2576891 RepID=A0A290Q3Y5_9BACT|nr:hypothetical protein CMV30_05100 [Nibricoccus aquaticus]
MSTAEQIKTRRESLGLDPKKMAVSLAMNEPSYWDLEGHDDELSDVAEFSQAIHLSQLLGVRLLALLEENFDYVKSRRLSFQDLHEMILRKISDGELKKDELSWDIDEFLEAPTIGFEYPILFLKLISPEVGFDWREVVAKYEDSELGWPKLE